MQINFVNLFGNKREINLRIVSNIKSPTLQYTWTVKQNKRIKEVAGPRPDGACNNYKREKIC